MIEKIIDLEELRLTGIRFSNQELKRIVDDLEKIGFFSEEIGKIETFCQKKFSVLRKTPDPTDKLNGQEYIREDYFENGKPIRAKIYNFNLKVSSTCS